MSVGLAGGSMTATRPGHTNTMPLPALLTLLFVIGLISPVYQGVRSAVLPEVLPTGPRYILGRALMRMVAQSAQIVGYGVGGLLLAILSPRGALAADALSFVASGLVLRFGTAALARQYRPARIDGSRLLRRAAEGFRPPPDQADLAVQLDGARVRGRARGLGRPLCH
jgi:hypothetical protein